MAEREHIRKSTTRDGGSHQEQDHEMPRTSNEGLTAEIDDLLDEIDEVLETNAEEFVKSYVQKGGQ